MCCIKKTSQLCLKIVTMFYLWELLKDFYQWKLLIELEDETIKEFGIKEVSLA